MPTTLTASAVEVHQDTEKLLKLCRATVLGTINHLIDDNAIVWAAACTLPGDMQRCMAYAKREHLPHGYDCSCAGYEELLLLWALKDQLARDQEVYAMSATVPSTCCSELITSVSDGLQDQHVLFDNANSTA